jgi:FdhD protein
VQLREAPPHVQQSVIRVTEDEWLQDDDILAAEEPLEIRLLWDEDGLTVRKSIAVTMRTPGDDFELAVGFLFGESIVRDRDDLVDVAYCIDEEDADQQFNIVTVTLRPGLTLDLARLERNFYTTSSCGVCGKATLEALELQGCEIVPLGLAVTSEVIRGLPEKLRRDQAVFQKTGGLHAAGLFDHNGHLLSVHEDVGRHNALDKLIGERVMSGTNVLDGCLLLLSGRASFELLQKALVARIPLVAAVGAPSSLAVELAQSFGITLIGFVRPDGFNIYTGSERILRAGALAANTSTPARR